MDLNDTNITEAFSAIPLEAVSSESAYYASRTYDIIMEEIRDFEMGLDNNHEVLIQLASFGKSITLAVTDIGYANPSTLFFYGQVNGKDATLIQHISQLNFLLLAAEKPDPNAAPRRIAIGFAPPSEEE